MASKEPPEISKAIESEAWKATDPAGLKVAGMVERSQPARAAVDRGRGARRGLLARQARVSSCPLHYPWIVDAQWVMFRGQLGNILENIFDENIFALLRSGRDLRCIFHHEAAKGAKDFWFYF